MTGKNKKFSLHLLKEYSYDKKILTNKIWKY